MRTTASISSPRCRSWSSVSNLNTLYSGNPLGNNQVAPQESTAYQAGMVARGDAFTLSADIYQVDFDNFIAKSGSGANAIFFNAGSVRYRGLEAEGNLLGGGGFSIYANGSINRGEYQEDGLASAGQKWKSGQIVSNVPRYTGVLGLLYQDHDWKASLLTKFTGSQYQGKNGEVDGPLTRSAPTRSPTLRLRAASMRRSVSASTPTCASA